MNNALVKASLVACAAFASSAVLADNISIWNFTGAVAGPDNTPAVTSTVTSAAATQLGMTNSYSSGASGVNTANCDVTSVGGDPNGASTGYMWRVRANTITGGAASGNGWSYDAPQYTQGAEFDSSTVGYSNVKFSFDFYCTTQGIRDMAVLYNTDVTNSSGWTLWKGALNGNQAVEHDASNDTLIIAASNGYNTAGTTVATNTIDLSGVAGAANDAKFGVQLVSAFDPNASYANGKNYSSAAGGQYNNSSGNWRFDQIRFDGVKSVPEVNPAMILGIAGLGLFAARRRRA